jgi:hypothetical protein
LLGFAPDGRAGSARNWKTPKVKFRALMTGDGSDVQLR